MNGDPIARTSEDCTCLRSGYSHSYACRERLIDRQRAEIEQLTRERDAMQRRAESAEADWMALSQDDGKVERALERSEQENDRLRALLSEVLPQHVDQPRGWSGEWNGSEENTWVGRVRAELSGEHSAHETTGDSGAELVAMLFPYLQRWQCADAAELEAKALLTERAERYLTVFAPKENCGLCTAGMNSFTDPDTGVRIHARNGTVTPCCAQEAPEIGERRIREDIKVGSTLFRAGVKLRIVLERIERGFKYHAESPSKAGDEP